MKNRMFLMAIMVICLTFSISGYSVAAGDDWVNINGTVTYNGAPACTMVLANGQYEFTCSGDGSFDLDVPLDGNGQITVFAFCSGLAPFKAVVYPAGGHAMNIVLEKDSTNKTMAVSYSEASLKKGWIRLNGDVRFNGSPVNAMVLANGQYLFTKASDGKFSLDVPLTSERKVTLFTFCQGLSPFQTTFETTIPDIAGYDGVWSAFATSSIPGPPSDPCGSATATMNVSGTTVTGSVRTSSGETYGLTGTVSENGEFMGRVMEDNFLIVRLEGNLFEQTGNGDWFDFTGCYGPWTATKQN